MELYQVKDQGHWFTQEEVNLFYERLLKLTGNKNIAREAGRYSASPDALGVMREYFLGFVGPAMAFEIVKKAASNFTKSSIYESKQLDSNKFEVVVTPNEGVKEEPFQCENRTGIFEAIAMMFNHKLPKIEHLECLFKEGKACRYLISWKEPLSVFRKRIRNYAALFLFPTCIGSYFIYSFITLTVFFPASVLIILLLSWLAKNAEIRELNAAIYNLRISSDRVLENIDINYNSALMINEIGLALSNQSDIDAILTNAMQVLKKRLDYDRGMVFLANPDKTKLIFHTGFGYIDKLLKFLKGVSFHLDRPGSKGVFAVSFRKQKPFLINDINEIADTITSHSLEFVKKMGVKSFICCPVIYKEESLGILAVDNINTKRPLIQSDINLLTGIAPEIGMSIRNVMLIEAQAEQFKSIIKVMAASIDARDPLTAGHSEMVTEYAVGISQEMGMSNEYCEMMRIAALLHDYGKIGIEDSILKKTGKLEFEEYETIKTHAAKTREILEQMNFKGIYKEVSEIAGSHHEKMDGSGYPRGLKGDEISLGARILAVADVFEAITSKRHYHDGMPLDDAVQFLDSEIGAHFDREPVKALLSYIEKKNRKDSSH